MQGANTELATGTITPSASPPTSSSSRSSSTTSVHVTALDAIVNVNSLFTVAVFIGLAFSPPTESSTGRCDATNDDVRKLVVFEVVSFSCFLFSSLVAQGLKLSINLLNSKDVQEEAKAHINFKVLRFGMIGSAFGSVIGCVFLVLSMVNVVQVRLGRFSCGGDTVYAVVTLIILVTTALFSYISAAVYAFLQ